MLIFPEGKRSDAGEIGRFRPGIGMIGARLDVPVVPVRLTGSTTCCITGPDGDARYRRASRFGAPIRLSGDDYAALARQVEDAVRDVS